MYEATVVCDAAVSALWTGSAGYACSWWAYHPVLGLCAGSSYPVRPAHVWAGRFGR
jgi:hypothetical protein